LIFGSYKTWKSIYGDIPVDPIRDQLIKSLPDHSFVIHDSMMQLEHSLEAITHFLQKNKKKVTIIPILIPYMRFNHMTQFSEELAKALHDIMKSEHLIYGKDLAFVISNDAIHYGDEDWGGSNLAPFGVDSSGTAKAWQKDQEIIEQCLQGNLSSDKIKIFNQLTIQDDNFKAYKWTWCGRYALPFGLLFANKLNDLIEHKSLTGKLIGHRSSYHNPHILVSDLNMGTTAPANNHHWVGYVGMGYQ
jgi:AmmeMemoRadiSam system protein B